MKVEECPLKRRDIDLASDGRIENELGASIFLLYLGDKRPRAANESQKPHG